MADTSNPEPRAYTLAQINALTELVDQIMGSARSDDGDHRSSCPLSATDWALVILAELQP